MKICIAYTRTRQACICTCVILHMCVILGMCVILHNVHAHLIMNPHTCHTYTYIHTHTHAHNCVMHTHIHEDTRIHMHEAPVEGWKWALASLHAACLSAQNKGPCSGSHVQPHTPCVTPMHVHNTHANTDSQQITRYLVPVSESERMLVAHQPCNI